jgi:hypothetical protein
MRKYLFLTAAALIAPGLAFAQAAPPAPPPIATPGVVLNEQLQLGDVFQSIQVTVPIAPTSIASSLAAGNVVSSLTTNGGQGFTNTQATLGQVSARTENIVGEVTGPVSTTASAYGNAGQSQAQGDTLANLSYQNMAGRTEATAFTGVTLGGTDIATSTTAVANAFGFENRDAEIGGNIAQRNDGAVFSSNLLSSCCNTNSATITSSAIGNSISGNGYNTTTVYSSQQERLGFGSVEAGNLVYSPTGTNVTSASQAAGNTHTMTNAFGYTNVDNFQNNQGYVRSESALWLDTFNGYAVSSAYGVGNSMLLSNSASDTRLANRQIAEGGVDAVADLTGASATGAPGILSSMAIGNAVTGFLCGNCGDPTAAPSISGENNQINYGGVRAFGTVNMLGASGPIIASGAAVGNTASFIARRGN